MRAVRFREGNTQSPLKVVSARWPENLVFLFLFGPIVLVSFRGRKKPGNPKGELIILDRVTSLKPPKFDPCWIHFGQFHDEIVLHRKKTAKKHLTSKLWTEGLSWHVLSPQCCTWKKLTHRNLVKLVSKTFQPVSTPFFMSSTLDIYFLKAIFGTNTTPTKLPPIKRQEFKGEKLLPKFQMLQPAKKTFSDEDVKMTSFQVTLLFNFLAQRQLNKTNQKNTHSTAFNSENCVYSKTEWTNPPKVKKHRPFFFGSLFINTNLSIHLYPFHRWGPQPKDFVPPVAMSSQDSSPENNWFTDRWKTFGFWGWKKGVKLST